MLFSLENSHAFCSEITLLFAYGSYGPDFEMFPHIEVSNLVISLVHPSGTKIEAIELVITTLFTPCYLAPFMTDITPFIAGSMMSLSLRFLPSLGTGDAG
jgi:hypothetical protein